MRFQTLIILLLALVVSFAVFAVTADAHKGVIVVPDLDVGKKGGGGASDDGGDPDGVGLDGPLQRIEPEFPDFNYNKDSAPAAAPISRVAAFRTLLDLLSTQTHLLW